jgi:hypothetical protein
MTVANLIERLQEIKGQQKEVIIWDVEEGYKKIRTIQEMTSTTNMVVIKDV